MTMDVGKVTINRRVRELMDLLAITNLTSDQVKTIAITEVEFAGEVIAVRPRTDSPQGGEAA